MPLGAAKVGLFGAAGSSAGVAWAGDRGLAYGGASNVNPASNVIDYFDITSAGNASDFGDLTGAGAAYSGPSNGSRGVMCSVENNSIRMDYVTIGSTGNATDFGDMSEAGDWSGSSNGTRGVMAGKSDKIEYITIATAGDATDFGDATVSRSSEQAAISNGDGDRGVFAGGRGASASEVTIDYVTISTTGNATDFGDLTVRRDGLACCASETRGCFMGGYNHPASGTGNVNTIDYITIGTTGDAADFGDLLLKCRQFGGTSNLTRGVACGGVHDTPSLAESNVIQYITIASTGNATDFGDLTHSNRGTGALSGD